MKPPNPPDQEFYTERIQLLFTPSQIEAIKAFAHKRHPYMPLTAALRQIILTMAKPKYPAAGHKQ